MTRKILLGGDKSLIAELGRDGVWSSNWPHFAKRLNSISKQIYSELSPADGEPKGFVFDRIVELFEPTEVIDDEPPLGPTPPGVTYSPKGGDV